MGLRETKKEEYKKQAYKYTAINKSEDVSINVLQSIFSMGLQRSQYLEVDNKLMFDLHQNPEKKSTTQVCVN